MGIQELYEVNLPRNKHTYRPVLSAFGEHLEVIKRAYQSLDMDVEHPNQYWCPGLRTEEGEFQASLMGWQAEDRPLGTHFLAHNPDKTWVTEGDIMLWDGSIDVAPGRAMRPRSRYIIDFTLTNEILGLVTQFVSEEIDTGRLTVMQRRQELPLSQ